MNPADYQRSILDKFEPSNSRSYTRLSELISEGIDILSIGTLEGPYYISQDYFMTNGEILTFISASRLSWYRPMSPLY